MKIGVYLHCEFVFSLVDVCIMNVVLTGVDTGVFSIVSDFLFFFFFFQAEDGIRDKLVTGVQTCALPILAARDSLRIGLSAPVEPPAASPGYPGFAGPEAPRVGLYRSYAAPIDEGWTRWVFDTWKVPYVSVVDSVVRAGKLREHFEVIVLPDQSPHELFDGLPRQYPAPYAGGLGQEGAGY